MAVSGAWVFITRLAVKQYYYFKWQSRRWPYEEHARLLVVTMSMEEGNVQDELEAMALWEAHLERAADQWKHGVTESQDDYRRGLAKFLGVSENEISENVSHEWDESVSQMSPEEFKQSIEGEGADWLTGLYEGVTGQRPPERVRQAAEQIEQEARTRSSENPSGEELINHLREEIKNRAHQTRGQTGETGGTQA